MTTLFDLVYDIVGHPYMDLLFLEGIATGGSTTTLIDTNATAAREFGSKRDGFWNGGTVFHLGDLELREITKYVQDTQTITFAPSATGFANADLYAVAAPTRHNKSLVQAVKQRVRRWKIVKEDTSTITIAANTRTYNLPSDCFDLREVWTRKDSTEVWKSWPSWTTLHTGAGTADQITFHTLPPASNEIRLVYCPYHPVLDTEDDTLDEQVHPDLVVHEIVMDFMRLDAVSKPRNHPIRSNIREMREELETLRNRHRIHLPQKQSFVPLPA